MRRRGIMVAGNQNQPRPVIALETFVMLLHQPIPQEKWQP